MFLFKIKDLSKKELRNDDYSPVVFGSSPPPDLASGELELGGRWRGQHPGGQEAGVGEAVRGQLVARLPGGRRGLGDLCLLSHHVLVQRIEILGLETL